MSWLRRKLKNVTVVRKLYDASYNFRLSRKSPKDVFSDIYHSHQWSSSESISGLGSDLSQTGTIIKELPKLFEAYGIKSLVDVPCGDFNWMKHVPLDGIHYIGGDIVAEIIAANKKTYQTEDIQFRELDLITEDLPNVDMVFCRDCLVHFSYENIFKAVDRVKASGATYFLSTTFTDRTENTDIPTGRWRPLNLQAGPVNFPEPIALINEGCTEADGRFADKCLGLWKVSDLPDFGSQL